MQKTDVASLNEGFTRWELAQIKSCKLLQLSRKTLCIVAWIFKCATISGYFLLPHHLDAHIKCLCSGLVSGRQSKGAHMCSGGRSAKLFQLTVAGKLKLYSRFRASDPFAHCLCHCRRAHNAHRLTRLSRFYAFNAVVHWSMRRNDIMCDNELTLLHVYIKSVYHQLEMQKYLGSI